MAGVILTAVWLIVMSVVDVRNRQVPLWMLTVQAALAVGILMWEGVNGELSIGGICRALIPGVILVIIALSTKKAGWADGVVLLLFGVQTDYEKCMVAVLMALFLMAALSAVLLVFHKVKKDTRLPFIPFLTMGWFLGLFLTGSLHAVRTV